ncbi:Phosphoribosylformylglycinamidine cyclo-ligase [bioreactor metagenome]|uniref:Phosphoribosylformylglycinamidine cyclo-ligase n=2 Tax=root TaxID=1 RepID=A0A645BST3_9ZZZZ
MYNVFNMGIGMILVVDPKDVDKTLSILEAQNEHATVIGQVIEGEGVHFQ